MRIEKGIIQNKIKLAKTKLQHDGFSFNEKKGKDCKNHIGNFMSDTFYDIKNDLPEYMSFENICSMMDNFDTNGVVNFFEEILDKLSKPKIHDFTKSLIFIIGNLDEVYTNHSNFNPDMDADMLSELSNNITITDVKSALSRRFRSEQIARLGNNHLIYSTLGVKTFKRIIKKELKSINKDIKDKYDISFKFNNTLKDILYKESVFPTQGARPVYSRVNSIVRPIISKLMKRVFSESIEFDTIEWDYKEKKHLISIIKGGITTEYKFDFPLQIEDLRESKNDDDQCKVAVHEAGHAVIGIVDLKLLPKSIYSKTADSESQGFCSFDLPEQRTREFYNNYIKVSLGGYVAEKMVFGDDNLGSGCYGDFGSSTSIASKMVKLFGMYNDPMLITTHSSPNYNLDHIKSNDDIETKIAQIINDNLKLAEETLEKYKVLFFNVSKFLSENSFMDQGMLKTIISKSNPELLEEIKDKDSYFNFKEQYFEFFGEGSKIKELEKRKRKYE